MTSARRGEPRKKVVWGGRAALTIALASAAMMSSSCGTLVRQGTGSSYLVLAQLTGPSGSSTVRSDVITNGSIVNDEGTATFTLGMKDVSLTPTPNNAITIDRYHVQFIRSDGRNVQGVDVPYAFDGAVTVTVSGSTSVGFTLVRHSAKEEAPLLTLQSGDTPFTTIAQVTFFGHDQTGHSASVSGNIEVTFGNFAD